jgi:molybdenum ABC transporter molybdate-binding protein
VEEPVKYLICSLVLGAIFLGTFSGARAQSEITLLMPGPIGRDLVPKVVSGFEMKTGNKVKVTFAQGSRDTEPFGTKQLVAHGRAQDVSVMFAPFPEALASGNIDPKTSTTITRIVLAVTVKTGATKPDISTPAAVKKMLLGAKAISIVDPAQGTLGFQAMEALQKLGIADQVQSKLKVVGESREAEEAVAKGEADLFIGPELSDKLVDGVEFVGGLPAGASTPIDVVGFVSTKSSDPKAAMALLQYLKSPEAEAAYKAAGMMPVN